MFNYNKNLVIFLMLAGAVAPVARAATTVEKAATPAAKAAAPVAKAAAPAAGAAAATTITPLPGCVGILKPPAVKTDTAADSASVIAAAAKEFSGSKYVMTSSNINGVIAGTVNPLTIFGTARIPGSTTPAIPAAGPHDYQSYATYYWSTDQGGCTQDVGSPAGSYYNCDSIGKRNDAQVVLGDAPAFKNMAEALVYWSSSNTYVSNMAKLLAAWFVPGSGATATNPAGTNASYMNPNFNYAQWVLPSEGPKEGGVEFRFIKNILESETLLYTELDKTHKSWTTAEHNAFVNWVGQMYIWMITSPITVGYAEPAGSKSLYLGEQQHHNNQAVWYDIELGSILVYLGNNVTSPSTALSWFTQAAQAANNTNTQLVNSTIYTLFNNDLTALQKNTIPFKQDAINLFNTAKTARIDAQISNGTLIYGTPKTASTSATCTQDTTNPNSMAIEDTGRKTLGSAPIQTATTTWPAGANVCGATFPAGSMPNEEVRSNNGTTYRPFNLVAFCTLADVAADVGVDLYHYQSTNGQGGIASVINNPNYVSTNVYHQSH